MSGRGEKRSTNIELKVRCADLDDVHQRAICAGAESGWVRRDTDTYFRVAQGRLKLRQTEGESSATLIAYHRENRAESRPSDFQLLPVDRPDELREMLTSTLGLLVTVTKTRTWLQLGTTRIHLDRVDDLGDFVELETLVEDDDMAGAEAEHRSIIVQLGLDTMEICAESYSDLRLNGAFGVKSNNTIRDTAGGTGFAEQ